MHLIRNLVALLPGRTYRLKIEKDKRCRKLMRLTRRSRALHEVVTRRGLVSCIEVCEADDEKHVQ